jgi:hypothetical protein
MKTPRIVSERPSLEWRLALALLLALLLAGAAASADEAPPRATRGAPRPGSVGAERASVPPILREVAAAAGIRLVLDPALEARVTEEAVTIAIRDLRPEAALRRLLPESHLLFVYSNEGALLEVQVYGPGRSPSTPHAASSRPTPPSAAAAPPGLSPTPLPDGDPRRLDRLRREAVTHPDAARRTAALEELTGRSDESSVRDTAIEMLARDRDPKVLEAALDVVSTLTSAPLEQIAQFVAAAREPALRIQALDILGERVNEDARVKTWLQSLSTTDGDDDVRSAARMLLDQGALR